jgi:AraC-like DNA-binding protein
VSSGFSTLDVAPEERFEFWRDMVRLHFVPLRIEPLGDGAFDGTVRMRSVADLSVARITADSMLAARGWRHIERSPAEEYFIALHLSGVAVAHQDGRRATLRRGDLALLDSSRPYRIEFHGARRFDHLIVRIPRAALESRCDSLGQATAIAMEARSDAARLVSSPLTALVAARDGADFVDPVLDLLARALGRAAGARAAPRSRAERDLERVKRYALAHLGDPRLAPARVAAACSISVRQLHRLFEREQATTFGAFVREQRLRRCRADLADPRLESLAIAEIAARHGLPGAPSFTRAFTRRYGMGPRVFRTHVRARARARGAGTGSGAGIPEGEA